MAINKLVSARLAIDYAMDMMAMPSSDYMPMLMVWAKEAELKIGSRSQFKRKRCVLTVEECQAKLPCDAVRVDVVLYGDHGCECDHIYNGVYQNFFSGRVAMINRMFLVVDPLAGSCALSPLNYEIHDNVLVFDYVLDIDKVSIQYLGMEVDDKGFILIQENHVEAIAKYLEYKMAGRSRWMRNGVKINSTDIRYLGADWSRLLKHCRAEDGRPTEKQRENVVSIMTNPFSGYAPDPFYESVNGNY